MISYLFYSSISLALLLLVYRFFLEKEKRCVFNRIFLLWSLLFSLIIPLIPVGIVPLEIPWSALFSSGEEIAVSNYQYSHNFVLDSEIRPNTAENNTTAASGIPVLKIAISFYLTILVLLFIRLIRIINRIQSKIRRNPKRFIEGIEVVLLRENVIPHTFFNTVFLNKKQFENGEIEEEVLNHEFTHVKQKHSVDIIIVELLKIIFWFNPLLYFYKNAIALNHEFLADEAVLSRGANTKYYQHMLLKTIEQNAMHGLASNFNFSLTKRRLQMMTQTKTNVSFFLKLTLVVPLFAGLSLMLGCEPVSNDVSPDIESIEELRIEILKDNALVVNGKRLTLGEFESLLSEQIENPVLVSMEVDPNAKFGMVTDVQSVLRRHKAFRIQYSSQNKNNTEVWNSKSTSPKDTVQLPPQPPTPKPPSVEMSAEERASFDKAGKEYQKVYQKYVRLDPKTTSFKELESAYKNVQEAANKLNKVFKEIGGENAIPPPIKLGPDPERRKLLSSEEARVLKAEMEESLQTLRQKWKAYSEIEPTQSNADKLEETYKEAIKSLEDFDDAQTAYYNFTGQITPPLPPILPNPEKRLKRN